MTQEKIKKGWLEIDLSEKPYPLTRVHSKDVKIVSHKQPRPPAVYDQDGKIVPQVRVKCAAELAAEEEAKQDRIYRRQEIRKLRELREACK
jgi:hypothetical protein